MNAFSESFGVALGLITQADATRGPIHPLTHPETASPRALGASRGKLLGAGLAVYGAVFAFVGARLKRPLVSGLVFAFGWEQLALALPGYLRQFTVAHHLQSLVPHTMPADSALSVIQGLFRQTTSVPGALTALALMLVVFLWLAMRTVARREYVLEQ